MFCMRDGCDEDIAAANYGKSLKYHTFLGKVVKIPHLHTSILKYEAELPILQDRSPKTSLYTPGTLNFEN